MDAIDTYIDALAARLRLGPARSRRFLLEAQDHLREAAAREVETGAHPADAQQRAIERFGTPRQVAAAANGSTATRLVSLVVALGWLGVLGSVTVLAGTLLAWVMVALTSASRVFGLPAAYHPAAGRVAHWLTVQPGAPNWHAAAATENADDTLLLRGTFALVCLVLSLVLLRSGRRLNPPPPGVVPALGTAVFGAFGVLLLLGAAMDVYTPMEWGRGLWLADGVAALLAGALCGAALLRDLRTA